MKIQLVLLVCFVAFVVGEPETNCPETDGPDPTYIGDNEDCAVFYECSGGKAFNFTCSAGTYWDKKVNSCNIGVDCGNLKTTTGAPTTEAPTTAAA